MYFKRMRVTFTKIIFQSAGALWFLFFRFVAHAHAVDAPGLIGPAALFGNPAGGSFLAILCEVLAWVGGIGVIVAFVMIVWSGALFMTSGGNAEKISQAKKTLVFAIVGFILLLLARSLPLILAGLAGISKSAIPDACK